MLFLFQCILIGGASPAYALRLKCADAPIAFEYEEPEEIKCVCETARAAIAFLKTLGLEATDVVTIRIVDHFPSHQMHNLLGCYHPESREVELLNYSKAVELSQKDKSILSFGISEDIWCGYAAHELAHAISSQYFDPEVKSHIAGEYISAVTQLTVLAPESRKKILVKYQDIEAYKSMSEMSILYFLFAPNEFAVKCYLHFTSQDKPKEFIDRLINEENGSWDVY